MTNVLHRAALLIPAILLLANCATFTPPTTTASIGELQQWRVVGKLGFRSPNGGGSASIGWQQQQELYQIELSGPFGAGRTTIVGDSTFAVLTKDGSRYRDRPELMAQRLTGAPIPVAALSWWLRGQPSPHSASSHLIYNDHGQLTGFKQLDWDLSIDRFTATSQGVLPLKVSGHFNNEYNFKMIIGQWEFDHPPGIKAP